MAGVALITGGSRGIGRAAGLALAQQGVDIAISFRRDVDAARDTLAALEAAGVHARAYQGGVEDAAYVDELVARVTSDLGPIGVLVHAAGIGSRGNSVVDTDPQELSRVMSVHAFAAHHLARAVVPGMRSIGEGRIILVSSIISNGPRTGTAPYVMAKAAIDVLALTLAMEERANGIRVNVVAPGLVATDMGDKLVRATQGIANASDLDASAPFGRVCRPEDVADCIAFLAGDRASYITGQRIAVDGGESWGWWGPPQSKEGT